MQSPNFVAGVPWWRLLLERKPQGREVSINAYAKPLNGVSQAEVQRDVLALVECLPYRVPGGR